MNRYYLLTILLLLSSSTLLADVFVAKNKKLGYTNESGELVVPCQYNDIKELPQFNMLICKKGNKYGILNTNGEVLMPVENTHIGDFSSAGWAVITGKNKQQRCVINTSAQMICPWAYTSYYVDLNGVKHDISDSKDTIGEVLTFCVGNTFYDLNGNIKGVFTLISEPNEDGYRAVVGKSDLWGVVNKAYDLTVPYRYTYMRKYHDATIIPEDNLSIFAGLDQKYGAVDITTDTIVIPMAYPVLLRCGNRMTIFKGINSGKFGMFRGSEMICPDIYDDLYTRVNTHSMAGEKNKKWQLYSFDTKSTTDFYDVCVPYAEEVDSCHGEMLYMMGKVNGSDTTYTIVNAYLQQVTPIQGNSLEMSKKLCKYFAFRPLAEMSSIDVFRLRLYLARNTLVYTLQSFISENDWDY